MADYLENGVRAMEKSLRDVVLPALDASDPLAREQLNLAIDYLGFLRARLDYATHRLRFELELYRDMAAAVLDFVGGALPAEALGAARAEALPLIADAWASSADLRTAVGRLSEEIDALVACAEEQGDEALRVGLGRIVHDATRHWIDLDRAWYAPIAVDPDDPGLKPLESFFPYRAPAGARAAA